MSSETQGVIERWRTAAESWEATARRLERALRFYADERNYDAHRNAPGIHAWEPDEKDPSRWWPKPVGWCDDRGSIARAALDDRPFYSPEIPGVAPPEPPFQRKAARG